MTLLRVLSFLFVVACAASPTASNQDKPAPQVTVAHPITAQAAEWFEYTGRAEAVDHVEIRARVAGYLQKVAFKEGDLVKKGDLLFLIDPRPFEATHLRAKAERDNAQASLDLAKLESQRAEQLFKSDAISQREVDTQRSGLTQASARLQIAEAALQEAALNLEFASVRAPVDGRTGRALLTVGNLVNPASAGPLTTLVSIDPLHVYADVAETQAQGLLANRKRTAHIGFVGEEGFPHDAVVDFIDNRVDAATGTVRVRAVVRNPGGKLIPGLFARLRLPEANNHEVTLIVDSAIATDQDRKFVYVVGTDSKAQYRAIKVGPLHDGLRIVREGLTADDTIVVHGLQRVHPGDAVTSRVVAMKADGLTETAAK